MKSKLRKVKVWFRANYLGYEYWRVTYTDIDKRSRLLSKEGASSLAVKYGGILWIDYTVLN